MRRIIRRKTAKVTIPEVVIGNILTLIFDLENVYGEISDFSCMFNVEDMVGVYCRPYMIKFVVGDVKRFDLKEIVAAVGYVPILIIKALPKTGFGLINMKNFYSNLTVDLANQLTDYMDRSETYYNDLHKLDVNKEAYYTLFNELQRLGFNVKEDDIGCGIIINDIIHITFNGQVYKRFPTNILSTGIKYFNNPRGEQIVISIGTFKRINNKAVSIPSSDHIALLVNNQIVDWMSLM